MGQMSSFLEFCGNVVRYRRGPDTSNVCPVPDAHFPVLPQQEAVVGIQTALVGIQTALVGIRTALVGIRTALVGIRTALETIKDTVNNSGERIGLSDCPMEIILIIAQYLTPSSLLSLSYTCARFRSKMGVSIEHSLGKKDGFAQVSRDAVRGRLPKLKMLAEGASRWDSSTMEQNMHHSERLKLLCMLDRDQKVPPHKAVCSDCADTHDRSLFSSTSLAQSSRDRRCFGSAGRIWVCPHWMFDHNLVTASPKPLASHFCGTKGIFVTAIPFNTTEVIVSWPIITLRGHDVVPSKEIVETILRRINLTICNHLRFSDAFVLRLYSPDCKKLRRSLMTLPYMLPSCRCSTCVWQLSQPNLAYRPCKDMFVGGKCESCGTMIQFRICADEKSEETLQLVTAKVIPTFRRCTDRAWIEQLTDPAQFEGLEREWNAAVNEDMWLVM